MDSYAISEELNYYEVSLDSEDFSSANSNSVTALNWPVFEIGGARTLVNIVGLKVIGVSVPFSYYIVNSSNNVFTLTESVSGPVVVTLGVGNYTSSQMITELDTQLTALGVESYTTTYSTSTNKFTITATTVTNPSFTLTFGTAGDQGNTDLHWYLGFNSGPNPSTANVLVSPNVINLSGPNYLYVNSEKWGQLTNNILPRGATNLGGGNRGPQMAKVPIGVGPNEIIQYTDPDPQYWFNVGFIESLQRIDFYLTLGNFKDVIDFNGLGFCIKLGVLEKKASIDITSQGGYQNGRSVKRSRPN